jgi:DNA repair protein RecN (Recombination protein N)
MLRRISLRDFVIVHSLELELAGGFSVLTGETGAGKSILIDALQLALGSRGDAGVVREGASRAEICAEFDTPAALQPWLDEAGFDPQDSLLLKRVIDTQGKSRAWINGSAATVGQLRELADALVDIHGQHAWQGLTRAPAVRALLDGYAQIDTAAMNAAWQQWKQTSQRLIDARSRHDELARERERLSWQIGELDRLAPRADEWLELSAEHQRLAHAQSLMDAAKLALDLSSESEASAETLSARAIDALAAVSDYDAKLVPVIEALQGAQAQLQDAAHGLASYLSDADLEPERLQELDERMSAWMSLARRYRRTPAELPALHAQWRDELAALDAASDLQGLERALKAALDAYAAQARQVSQTRAKAAPQLSDAVSSAMQQLGMSGGRFEVALLAQAEPQSFGMESAEFLVAGHAGSTPRPLAKVASGGELSRIALAIAVTTCKQGSAQASAPCLIFDEIDAGVGGAVAETVGRLMKQLGRERQVLAVTHLPQVAACADHHFVVSKSADAAGASSDVQGVQFEARVAEVARMLGGERLSSTSLAHAQEMLDLSAGSQPDAPARPVPARKAK